MAASESPSKRRRVAARVQASEELELKIYSVIDRHDLEEIMPLQKHFSEHFLEEQEEQPKKGKISFKNTGIANHCVYRPLNLCLFQVSNMIYPDFKNCRDVGWIACNSVLSGLYAKGIIECDSIMMNFVISTDIAEKKREKVIDDVVAGFKACAEKAKVEVTNSPLLTSKYMMIGGIATAICHISDFATCDEAVAGDTIVITKPLGVLVAARAKDMSQNTSLNNPNILSLIDEAFESAMLCMKRSNKTASILMKKYEAHAAIDLNGQNLLQTAHELAKIQEKLVEFRIDVLPLIKHTKEIDEYVKSGLIKGLSPELCGGLLICFSKESAKEFIKEITTTEGPPCFYIGSVIGGCNIARMNPKPQILPITIQPKLYE